ncbi:reverse transcriptase family protein [Tabrizicola sp.]|uniref:reverse transcriptase family protein n=1 Tax=Tabrizicola sp. TaxID=2005166 RepID=UPI0035B3B8C9
MRLRDVLVPLSASLSQCDWTLDGIEAHLRQRLPRSWVRIPALIARDLRAAFPGQSSPDPSRISRALQQTPHAARLLAQARKTPNLPHPWLAPPTFRPIPALADLPLPHLITPDQLADWLALQPDQLIRFTDPHSLSARNPVSFARHYHCHLIPKRDGTLRLIEEPKPVLKRLQRRILHGLLDHVPTHPSAHGFVRGRNCIDAAAKHAGEAVVLSFDLADFFPGIPWTRVYATFRALGYPQAVARALAQLTTALTPHDILQTPTLAARDPLKGRHLPQGAPTSPALANLAAFRFDDRLSALARRLGARYTRYADDLTFSGDPHIAPILARAIPEIAQSEGFRLNPAKTRRASRGQRQTVTGLVVNQHVNVPRPTYDRIKTTIHHLQNPEDPRRADPAFLARLRGQIGWVEAVNPAKGVKLRDRLADALA